MQMEAKQIALIPAYEPGEIMIDLIHQLTCAGLEVIVVDDGSGSGFEDIFIRAGRQAKILRHENNRGKGAAIKTGLRYIADTCPEPYAVITVDADGQHRPEDVQKVLQAVDENKNALILGSRHFTGKVPARSRFGNTVTRYVCRFLGGLHIYDTQTGLRAFSHRLVPALMTIEGDRYEYEMNMLMAFQKEKRPMIEVEIETVYLDDNSSSHFHTVRDSFRIYKEILKFSAASIAGFLIDYILFCGLLAATGKLALSNIGARLVSAGVNYTLNRKLVFDSHGSVLRSGVQYALLAVFILMGNTVFLRGLTEYGVNGYMAKIMTELVFFLFSWSVQHNVIFGKEAQVV